MAEITDLLDEAAAELRPYTFDVDALVARTRVARRRRRSLQVAGSSLGVVAVVGLSAGGVAVLGSGHSVSPGAAVSASSLPGTGSPATNRSSAAPARTAAGLTPHSAVTQGRAPAPTISGRIVFPNLSAHPAPLPRTSSPTLPPGFGPACGHPGAKLLVRIVPVTIPHRICNLSDVVVRLPDGVSATVPAPGTGVAMVPAGSDGAAESGLQIETDKTSGDVTISRP